MIACSAVFFKQTISEVLEGGYHICPHFLERCVLFILRSACELLPSGSLTDPGKAQTLNNSQSLRLQPPETTSTYRMKQAAIVPSHETIWSLLRLLRSLPAEYIGEISGQVSLALSTFLR
jgi:hypothetical protein